MLLLKCSGKVPYPILGYFEGKLRIVCSIFSRIALQPITKKASVAHQEEFYVNEDWLSGSIGPFSVDLFTDGP